MYKIVYKNLSFPSKETILHLSSIDRVEENIFTQVHRYKGNHMEGHGVCEYKIYEIPRKEDDDVNKEIEEIEEEIEELQHRLQKLKERSRTPYREIFIRSGKMGSLPTDEELLKEGWSEEQVKNRISIQ